MLWTLDGRCFDVLYQLGEGYLKNSQELVFMLYLIFTIHLGQDVGLEEISPVL